MLANRDRARAFAVGAVALFVALGCAAPISVKRVSPERVQRKLTGSVLSQGGLSEASRNVFRRVKLLEVFEDDPELALATAHELITQSHRSRLSEPAANALVAISEGCFLHASRSGDRPYFALAAVYAWAFLFAGESPLDPLDPQVRLAANLYNRGLTLALTPDRDDGSVELGSRRVELPIGSLDVALDPDELRWGSDRVFTRFRPVADLEIRGLRNRYRDSGIGAPLAAETKLRDGLPRAKDPVHERVQVPVSLILVLDDVMEGLRSGQLHGRVEIQPMLPDATLELQSDAGPRRVATEQEPSAALALMLSEVQPWKDEFRAFFQGDLQRSRDGLTALSLHRRGGIPVILVHGTASSSATWANMMNDLLAEPEIRRSYEFWLFTYNSGAPVLYSASLLRKAIADTVASLGADHRDPALKRAVVIGHSQGGLLTKLTAVRSEGVFWNRISDVPLESLDMKPATRALIESAIFVEPSPYVSRVVYIATPHRGSFLLNWGATSILRRLVRAPSTVARATADLVSQNPESAALRRIDDVEGALGQMHPTSPFLEQLLPLEVEPPVEAHSIIAEKEFLGKERSSDGVVRYRSAQLDGVQSEVVVQSGHSCLDHPHVVEEVRRILLMHLGMAPRVNSRD